jgi:hypothetical protein
LKGRKEGMMTTVTSSLQLTWLSSNDAYNTSLVKIARRVGVWGGVLTHSLVLVLLRSCNSSWRFKCNQGMNERTNQQRFSPANFVYRPQARTHEAGWRRRPLETRACLRRRWLVATSFMINSR